MSRRKNSKRGAVAPARQDYMTASIIGAAALAAAKQAGDEGLPLPARQRIVEAAVDAAAAVMGRYGDKVSDAFIEDVYGWISRHD